MRYITFTNKVNLTFYNLKSKLFQFPFTLINFNMSAPWRIPRRFIHTFPSHIFQKLEYSVFNFMLVSQLIYNCVLGDQKIHVELRSSPKPKSSVQSKIALNSMFGLAYYTVTTGTFSSTKNK